MAKQTKLQAQTRAGAGRTFVKKLRSAGRVPAVIYAAREQNQNLSLDARARSRMRSPTPAASTSSSSWKSPTARR